MSIKRRILQIDGGGILGIMPATVISRLDELLIKHKGKTVSEAFDMILGTSTGAIIGAAVAADVEPQKILSMYINKGAELFHPRNRWNPANLLRPKYDREPFIQHISNTVNRAGKPMSELKLMNLKSHFMATSFNLCSQRTHFLKSWDDYHSQFPLVHVVSWSALSAAYYFGHIPVKEFRWTNYLPDGTPIPASGAVFQDGGQGINNNTVHYALTEVLANNWDEDGVFILSLGTGNINQQVSFEKASKADYLGEIFRYPFQARNESTLNQILAGQYITGRNPKVKFRRIDCLLKKEENELDKTEYIDRFAAYGLKMAEQIDEKFIHEYF